MSSHTPDGLSVDIQSTRVNLTSKTRKHIHECVSNWLANECGVIHGSFVFRITESCPGKGGDHVRYTRPTQDHDGIILRVLPKGGEARFIGTLASSSGTVRSYSQIRTLIEEHESTAQIEGGAAAHTPSADTVKTRDERSFAERWCDDPDRGRLIGDALVDHRSEYGYISGRGVIDAIRDVERVAAETHSLSKNCAQLIRGELLRRRWIQRATDVTSLYTLAIQTA